MRTLEDSEWVAGLPSISAEHESTEVPACSRDVHELAEQGPGRRKWDGPDRFESDKAALSSDL